ncbi:E3 ubiquitin-protein ligase listerin [Merluccius polli]|uniref:E3 ubiquitin-protein ligase listerin n=1 Tax=Merluccius polli TaxID=89951 RepID=A0AA47NNU4_MERPO|nr:E3 ubiquitin-protein ligase listerin [Merluccius polli]
MELVIQLPQNHPLGSITVESARRVGVAVQQWRNWMLQLSTYLTHQNGSIMEGLALWKNNVDKRFEGVEDCMICFSGHPRLQLLPPQEGLPHLQEEVPLRLPVQVVHLQQQVHLSAVQGDVLLSRSRTRRPRCALARGGVAARPGRNRTETGGVLHNRTPTPTPPTPMPASSSS